jgi:hypothetical protein
MRRLNCTLISIILFLFAFCESVSAVRNAPLSSYIALGSPAALGHFAGDFAFSGGVSPSAREVKFLDSLDRTIPTAELNILFSRIGGKDYVAIKSGNETYELPMPNGMACPLARYVTRNASIAFTIPSKIDIDFFTKNKLVRYQNTNAYIAREFSNTRFADFLKDLDLDTTITTPLPNNFRSALMNEINAANQTRPTGRSDSYVNADFHVTYSAYLINKSGRNIVDIAGLPLRYYWSIASNGKAAINNVHVFSFPSTEEGLLYDAVLFFQNTAIFKQFNEDTRSRFVTFTNAACGRLPSPTQRNQVRPQVK